MRAVWVSCRSTDAPRLKHRGNVPAFLEVESKRRGYGDGGAPSFDGVRLALTRGTWPKPKIPAELPHAGERRRNAAASVLPWH